MTYDKHLPTAPAPSVEMLDQLQYAHHLADMRRKEEADAREMWPSQVNEVLRRLIAKVADQDARIAALEAGLR
jgi:hypothetical protein